MKRIIFFTAIIAVLVPACKSSKETTKKEISLAEKPALDCSSAGLTYASIKPIIEGNCTLCHSKGGTGGFDFTVFSDVKKAAQKGKLLGTIKHESGFPKMPARASKLDQTSIDQIECWINNGMKE